jgi:TonB family protein
VIPTLARVFIFVVVVVVSCFTTAAKASRQADQRQSPLPTVIAAAMPGYTSIGRLAGIAGTVRVRVVTDGEKVRDSVVEQPNPLLDRIAQENLKTWRFAPHVPTSFDVTFRFKLIDRHPVDPCGPRRKDPWVGPEAVSTLRFPNDIEIEGYRDFVYVCDPTVTGFLNPVSHVSGTVVCVCEGRNPVADADVVIVDRNNEQRELRRTRTDARGRFSFGVVKFGTNHIVIEKRGFYSGHFEVKVLPVLWHRLGGFAFELAPDPADLLPEPRRRALLVPETVPFHPAGARDLDVQGSVWLRLSADGDLTPIAGPETLMNPTLQLARTWKPTNGDDPDDLHFVYKLIDGDCLGGGPVVTMKGFHEMEVVSKRIVPCGPR